MLIESRKEISKDKSRKRLDYREKSMMLDEVIHVIVVDIIFFVDYDRVFLEASNAFTTMKIYALTCTSNLFRSIRIFVTLVQICIIRYALEEISKICDVFDRYKFVKTSNLFILSLLFFVFFLFLLIDYVMRLNIFMSIVA